MSVGFPGTSLQIPATWTDSPDGEWVVPSAEADRTDATTYESGLIRI